MARTFLSVDETNVPIAGNGTEVFGQTGDESVQILDGYTGIVLDQNIEEVAFEGNYADYTFVQQGINLLVQSGGNTIATIPVQNDANGTQLTFADGTVDAAFDGTTINVGTDPVDPTDSTDPTDPTDSTDPTDPTDTPDHTFTLTDSTTDKPAMTLEDDQVDAPIGTLQATDNVADPSSTDNDVMNMDLFQNIQPDISNVETVNVDVKLAGLTLTAQDIEHDTGNTINLASGSNVQDLAAIANVTVNSVLSFSAGAWNNAGAAMNISAYSTNTALNPVQTRDIVLNGTNLIATFDSAAGAESADIDFLNVESTGTSANILNIGAAAANGTSDLNEAGEQITVSGDQDLTIQGNDVHTNGIIINKDAQYTGELTLRVDVQAAGAIAMNVSQSSADTVRFDIDNSGAPITAATGQNLDLRAEQAGVTTLQTRVAADTTSDEITVTLTGSDNTAGTIAFDMGGITTNVAGQGFETVNIVTAGNAAVGANPHVLGGFTGSAATGTDLNISGDDRVAVGVIANTNEVDASGMTDRLTITVDTLNNTGSTITAGTSTSDILTVTDATVGALGTVIDMAAGTASAVGGAQTSFQFSAFERVVATAFNDTITGSTGDDRITGGTGADTMDGGTGVDQYVIAAVGDSISAPGALDFSANATAGQITAAGFDTIAFVDGSDLINVNAITGGVPVVVNNGNSAEGLDLANATNVTTGQIYVFGQIDGVDVSSDGLYIGIANATAAAVAEDSGAGVGDGLVDVDSGSLSFSDLIHLTGVSDASDITVDDFVF